MPSGDDTRARGERIKIFRLLIGLILSLLASSTSAQTIISGVVTALYASPGSQTFDPRQCTFFQVNNAGPWYAIPLNDPGYESELRACPKIIESTSDRVTMEFTTVFSYHMVVVIDVEPIRERFSTVAPFLDERGRRLVAAAEAFAAGSGGIAAVAMATGMAASTIGRGLKELAQDEPDTEFRVN